MTDDLIIAKEERDAVVNGLAHAAAHRAPGPATATSCSARSGAGPQSDPVSEGRVDVMSVCGRCRWGGG